MISSWISECGTAQCAIAVIDFRRKKNTWWQIRHLHTLLSPCKLTWGKEFGFFRHSEDCTEPRGFMSCTLKSQTRNESDK